MFTEPGTVYSLEPSWWDGSANKCVCARGWQPESHTRNHVKRLDWSQTPRGEAETGDLCRIFLPATLLDRNKRDTTWTGVTRQPSCPLTLTHAPWHTLCPTPSTRTMLGTEWMKSIKASLGWFLLYVDSVKSWSLCMLPWSYFWDTINFWNQ